MLLRCTRHGTAGQNLNSLLNSRDLVSTELLPVGEVRRLLLAGRGEISEVLGVVVTSGGGILEVALGIGSCLQRLCLRLRLLGTGRGGLADLRLQVLREHLECVPCVGLFLL